jgi:hypothetical protein
VEARLGRTNSDVTAHRVNKVLKPHISHDDRSISQDHDAISQRSSDDNATENTTQTPHPEPYRLATYVHKRAPSVLRSMTHASRESNDTCIVITNCDGEDALSIDANLADSQSIMIKMSEENLLDSDSNFQPRLDTMSSQVTINNILSPNCNGHTVG